MSPTSEHLCGNKRVLRAYGEAELVCTLPKNHERGWHEGSGWGWAEAKPVFGPKRELSVDGGD